MIFIYMIWYVSVSTECVYDSECVALCSATLPPSICTIWLSRLQFSPTLGYAPYLSRCALIQICKIENVSHLSELSVLNLAGNGISRVENLQGLDCLTELNLRHNCISVVVRGLFHNKQRLKEFYSLRVHYCTLFSRKGHWLLWVCRVSTISFSTKSEVSALLISNFYCAGGT